MLDAEARPHFAGRIIVGTETYGSPCHPAEQKAGTEVSEIPAICNANKVVLRVVDAKMWIALQNGFLANGSPQIVRSLNLGFSPGLGKRSDVAK